MEEPRTHSQLILHKCRLTSEINHMLSSVDRVALRADPQGPGRCSGASRLVSGPKHTRWVEASFVGCACVAVTWPSDPSFSHHCRR